MDDWPRLGRFDLLFYQRFIDSPVDMSVSVYGFFFISCDCLFEEQGTSNKYHGNREEGRSRHSKPSCAIEGCLGLSISTLPQFVVRFQGEVRCLRNTPSDSKTPGTDVVVVVVLSGISQTNERRLWEMFVLLDARVSVTVHSVRPHIANDRLP